MPVVCANRKKTPLYVQNDSKGYALYRGFDCYYLDIVVRQKNEKDKEFLDKLRDGVITKEDYDNVIKPLHPVSIGIITV